jgi:RHS repeat-associated protein
VDNVVIYQNDHLGTPQKLTAVNGAVVWSAKYSSFGKAEVDDSSSITNNLRFPGQYYDQETGFHYNYRRYYDPMTGRYFTPDPIGLRGGINLFSYVLNNPINHKDYFGLECEDCPGGEWEGSSFFGVGAFGGGGGTIDRVFWNCKTSSATCEAVYFCFGGGAIAEASIDVVGVAKATGANKSSDLAGWSTGWRGVTPLGSATVTEGLNNGVVIEHVSSGATAGLGVAKITCMTLSTTCGK